MISIDLTDQDAEAFKSFMQRRDEYQKLVDAQFFDVKSGVVMVHFNHAGQIMRVEVPRVTIFHVGLVRTKGSVVDL